MLIIVVISLLTIGLVLAIFGGAFVALVKHPPVIKIEVVVPPEFKLVLQKQPASIETDKPTEVAIPAEILDYISKESDTWAQDARKRRVRALYNDSNDWKYAFRQLQIEDGLL